MTNYNDSEGFLSFCTTHVFKDYVVEPPQIPTTLALIAGEGMKHTREIAG